MEDRVINIVVVDDHKIFRDGLKYVLNQEENINVIGEAKDGIDFLNLLSHVRPDLVLLDVAMPRMNGIDATIAASKKYPDIKIIALTMFDDDRYYYEILHAGAKSIVLKESESEILLTAIINVVKGNSYFSKGVLEKIIISHSAHSSKSAQKNKHLSANIALSEQESEVLKLIFTGLSFEKISARLASDSITVHGIYSELLSKTGSNDMLALLQYCLDYNLFKN